MAFTVLVTGTHHSKQCGKACFLVLASNTLSKIILVMTAYTSVTHDCCYCYAAVHVFHTVLLTARLTLLCLKTKAGTVIFMPF